MPASLCGDDDSNAPTLSSPRQRNALLEDSAAKISIHQTRFHFTYRPVQRSVGQGGPTHTAIETSCAEDAWHDHTVPLRGMA